MAASFARSIYSVFRKPFIHRYVGDRDPYFAAMYRNASGKRGFPVSSKSLPRRPAPHQAVKYLFYRADHEKRVFSEWKGEAFKILA
jgi:hypothetical protein